MAIGFEVSGANNGKITFTNHQGFAEEIVIASISGWRVQDGTHLVLRECGYEHKIKFAAQPPLNDALALLESLF